MSILKKNITDQPVVEKASRKVKKGRPSDKRNRNLKTISVASTILFIVILLVFNVVFDSLLGDKLKWDWTPGGQYSIGDVSKEILAGMTQNVEIVGLFDSAADSYYQQVQPMLDEYAKFSNGKLTVRYVNPDINPGILTELDPDDLLKPTADTFVVICKDTGKAKNVIYTDIYDISYDENYNQQLNGITAEESFTGAIKYVQSTTTPVVYFTTGHDELDYAANYSSLVTIIKNNNFDVKSLDLFSLTEMPADCSVLIMVSPQKDITAAEHKLIADYLQRGGSLLFISDFNNTRFDELNLLLVDYNLEVSNNKLREGDTDYRFQDNPYIMRAIAPANTITKTMIDGFTLVDNVRGMNELKNTKEWIKVEAVLTTSADGYAEPDGNADQATAAGTQNIALLSENRGWIDGKNVVNTAKVMLVGSSSIFSDSIIQAYGDQLYNAYLFYYGVQWLSNTTDTDSLYIESKLPPSYAITKGSSSLNVFTAVFVMLFIPAGLLIAALVVYRKRRHL